MGTGRYLRSWGSRHSPCSATLPSETASPSCAGTACSGLETENGRSVQINRLSRLDRTASTPRWVATGGHTRPRALGHSERASAAPAQSPATLGASLSLGLRDISRKCVFTRGLRFPSFAAPVSRTEWQWESFTGSFSAPSTGN